MENQPQNKPIIELRSIKKSYGSNTIINDFNLAINNGEFVTILGPSGCGKTTVLRLLAGLEELDSGSIILDGEDITNVPAEKRHINTVFQSYALFPHMTIFENVAFGLRMQKVPNEEIKPRVLEALRMVQLEEMSDRKPTQLSGGQQQRVALARALAPNPELILLDEPFSALDEHLRQQIRQEMLQALRQSGASAIFVTHDRDESLRYADKIAIIQQGKILQIDTPRTLYWSPNHLETAKFMGESIVLPANLLDENTAQCQLGNIPIKNKSISQNQGRILLRPEQFSLFKTSENPTALFNGQIKQIEFKGKITSIQIEINGYAIWIENVISPDLSIGDNLPVYLHRKGLFYA